MSEKSIKMSHVTWQMLIKKYAEILVKTPKKSDVFMNMNPAIFKRSWLDTRLLQEDDFEEKIEHFEDLDVAESVLEKQEEELLVEHFLALQIDKTHPATLIEVEEVP